MYRNRTADNQNKGSLQLSSVATCGYDFAFLHLSRVKKLNKSAASRLQEEEEGGTFTDISAEKVNYSRL